MFKNFLDHKFFCHAASEEATIVYVENWGLRSMDSSVLTLLFLALLCHCYQQAAKTQVHNSLKGKEEHKISKWDKKTEIHDSVSERNTTQCPTVGSN
jgi:hypothetical protein